jgi:radical SAM superfamily enzyme YgiQ (UPF0313 family)
VEKFIISSETFKKKHLERIHEYAFIALSAYAWSENLVNILVNTIRPKFKGKIILGGYEVTASKEEDLQRIYPGVDFYVKGYAEKSLEKIFKTKTSDMILDENITEDDLLHSPYILKILSLNNDKIHLETKRGCPYHCDFCEHGAAANRKIIRINNDRLEEEIELFRKNNVQNINVLDPTFLLKEEDNIILEKLLEIETCKEICLQMHFDTIKGKIGERFIEICYENKNRISLEFGLQSIIPCEMEMLCRKNNISHIKKVMRKLNENGIKYSISIIYGIPGQTVDTLQQTIDFIEENGCHKICAYPLRLPKNSKMRKRKDELQIQEIPDEPFSLSLVCQCFSFSQADWEKMYTLVERYRPPLSGDPLEAIRPVSERVLRAYLNGGTRCLLKKDDRHKKSIFGM